MVRIGREDNESTTSNRGRSLHCAFCPGSATGPGRRARRAAKSKMPSKMGSARSPARRRPAPRHHTPAISGSISICATTSRSLQARWLPFARRLTSRFGHVLRRNVNVADQNEDLVEARSGIIPMFHFVARTQQCDCAASRSGSRPRPFRCDTMRGAHGSPSRTFALAQALLPLLCC